MGHRCLLYIVNRTQWIDFMKCLLEINFSQKRKKLNQITHDIFFTCYYHSQFVSYFLMLSDHHNFNFFLCSKQYYEKFVLCLLAAPLFLLQPITELTSIIKDVLTQRDLVSK